MLRVPGDVVDLDHPTGYASDTAIDTAGDTHVGIHTRSGHGLGGVVTQRGPCLCRCHPDDRQQCPHVEDRRQSRTKRSGRQIGGEARHGLDADMGRDRARARNDELYSGPLAHLQAQPSGVDPTVERVEQRSSHRARRLADEAHLAERSDRR
jgi:hypothetical protein